jgi:NADPH:quinone reductase-like Zn-dependent oxidoreductase
VKAIVIHKYGGPEELKFEDYADPVPGPGEVLVRVVATSINPFDLMRRSGAAKDFAPIKFPGIVGVDLSGVVVKAGPGVQGFSAGDHIFGIADQTYAELCVAKAKQLQEAASLGADRIVATDDEKSMASLPELDAVADTVNGKTAETLIGKVKRDGVFATVLGVPQNAKDYPSVKVVPVYATPDIKILVYMAQAVKAGRLKISIARRLALKDAEKDTPQLQMAAPAS